jgi:hypothetical protein
VIDPSIKAQGGTNKEQTMVWTRVRSRVAGALILGMTVVSPVLSGGPTVWLMTFTIDDDPSYAVAGDGLDPIVPGAPGVYKDYRLGTGQPDDVNYCVEGSPSPGLFIRLNRQLDGEAGTQYCGLSGGSPRQFFVTISNDAACAELWSHGYPTGPDSPCTFTGVDKPRIRITNDLYGKKTTRTPVAFLSKWYDVSATSYEVRLDTDATVAIVGVDPSMRIVAYSGSARLWRFEPGVRERAVAQAFPLPFQMTFRRTAR